jgi:hypothetical protein
MFLIPGFRGGTGLNVVGVVFGLDEGLAGLLVVKPWATRRVFNDAAVITVVRNDATVKHDEHTSVRRVRILTVAIAVLTLLALALMVECAWGRDITRVREGTRGLATHAKFWGRKSNPLIVVCWPRYFASFIIL